MNSKNNCVRPLVCPGPGLRNRFPGVRCHRRRVHRPDALGWHPVGVLSLLRQLRREDAAEAEVVHQLSQECSLLGHVRHDSHHPVSACVSAGREVGEGGGIFFDDALSETKKSPSSFCLVFTSHGSVRNHVTVT